MPRPRFLPIIALTMILSPGGLLAIAQTQGSYTLSSPNSHIQLNIQTGERLTYDVLVNGKPVVTKSTLSIDIDHTTLGLNPKVTASKQSSVDREISCPIPH